MALAFEVEAPLVEWAENVCVNSRYPFIDCGRFYRLVRFAYRDEKSVVGRTQISQVLRLFDVAVQGPNWAQQWLLQEGCVEGL